MNVKYLSFIFISFAVGATNLPALVNFFWEESDNDVVLTVQGSFDVTGWSVVNSNTFGSGVSFSNIDDGPMFGEPAGQPEYIVQQMQINQTSTGGLLTRSPSGEFVLFPWDTPTGAELMGNFDSGTFAGQISLLGGNSPLVSASLQTSSVVGSIFDVDAVYRFSNRTLDALFGDGLAAWSSGAHIANIGDNEVWFTAIPEPSTYALLFGVAGLILVLGRRRLTRR